MADDDIEITTDNSLVQSSSLQDKIVDQSRSQIREDIPPLDTSDPSTDTEILRMITADISDTQNTEQAGIDVAQKAELMKMVWP
jgi:hypothetical protein